MGLFGNLWNFGTRNILGQVEIPVGVKWVANLQHPMRFPYVDRKPAKVPLVEMKAFVAAVEGIRLILMPSFTILPFTPL